MVQGMVRASAEAEVRAGQGEGKGGNVAGTQRKRGEDTGFILSATGTSRRLGMRPFSEPQCIPTPPRMLASCPIF